MSGRRVPDNWSGILSAPLDGLPPGARDYPRVEAAAGMVVEHCSTRFVGRVVHAEADGLLLRGFSGRERVVRPEPGAFKVDGFRVTLVGLDALVPATPPAPKTPARTASGSIAADAQPRVAGTNRILVEGVHDAEIVERVWGDDLRVAGVPVEYVEGVDNLAAFVRAFAPGPPRRLGILVDHLVPGSKEERVAREVSGPDVLVTGTPYIDVWQAVKPGRLGIDAWPDVAPGRPWKQGVCAALGYAEPALLWRRILGSVKTWDDVETPLVTAVERLIDFVTAH